MPEVHDMRLSGAMEFGVGEWVCSACARRLLIRHTPFEKIVLAVGNSHANHVSMVGDKRVVNVGVPEKYFEVNTDSTWLLSNGMSWSD